MLFGNPVLGRIGAPGNPDPQSGFVVTSPFGPRGSGFHDGLDIDNGGADGDPILAMAAGRVYQSFRDDAAGGAEIIRLDHGNGWTTGYAHMRARLVAVGDEVAEGEPIGELGATGWVTGPHLHMDTSYQNERRDPWPLLKQNGEEEVDPLQWLDEAKPYTALASLAKGQPLRSSPVLTSGNITNELTYDYEAEVAVVVQGDEYHGSRDWLAYPRNDGGWYTFARAQASRIVPVDYADAAEEGGTPDPCAQLAYTADAANRRAMLIAFVALVLVFVLAGLVLLSQA